MVKSDKWINHMCLNHKMIDPYVNKQISEENGFKIVSYGLSSYGYDIRCGYDFKISKYANNEIKTILDPSMSKQEFNNIFHDINDDADLNPHCLRGVILDPGDLCLTTSIEYFKIPRSVLGVCLGKSTYARLGIFVNITPLEPEWEGHLTIEISNIGSNPVRIRGGEGIAQLLFQQGSEICKVSYKDKKGKYQKQDNKVTYATL